MNKPASVATPAPAVNTNDLYLLDIPTAAARLSPSDTSGSFPRRRYKNLFVVTNKQQHDRSPTENRAQSATGGRKKETQMGRAFHRKSISIERPHTRGTGIRYVEPHTPVVRKLTADELAEKERTKAAVDTTRGVREWNMFALETFSGHTLDAWEDKILVEKNIADGDRYFPTEKAVDRAMQMVRAAVGKHCDKNGVAIDGLLGALDRRRSRIQPNGYLNEALEVVVKNLDQMFEKVLREERRPKVF
jgi:hypothetical protein